MRLKATLITLGAMAVCIGLFFGWKAMSTVMFLENPQYTVKTVEISTRLAVTPQEVMNHTGIREGINIFSFNASDKRQKLLRNVPNLSDVRIVKTMPDKVQIVAIDRLPVMRLGETSFAADKDGNIMTLDEKQRGMWLSLPILLDSTERTRPVPGQRITGKAAIALAIVKAYNEMDGISFRIEYIDTSGRVYIILQTADSRREIRLVWDEMVSADDMRTALRMASESLAQPAAASLLRFDVVLSTMKVYGI